MPAKGDRVVFEGNKVGGARREGELLAVNGRLVRVRWLDGTESTLFPGAGAMRVVTGEVAATHGEQLRASAGRAAKKAAPTKGSTPKSTQASGTIKSSVARGSSKSRSTVGGDFKQGGVAAKTKKTAAAKKDAPKPSKKKR
ncbi:MAG: DUF1918 domain-containing protein [Actinomycetota bacterium]|nr:DUF1918 domain-containing protein [Actinomycetota bacterium]